MLTTTSHRKIKIARIVTVPMSFNCLTDLLKEMSDGDFDVHLISSCCPKLDHYLDEKYTYHDVEIPREISLKKDIKALITLYRIFRHEKFDIVHSHTPKAGLLVAIAAFCARIPVRIHTFTGQVWANYTGLKRLFFIMLDRLVSELNTINYTDGLSQEKYLIANSAVRRNKIKVLGQGSHYGINIDTFKPNELEAARLKNSLDLKNSFVIGYVGRLNKDKGIPELIKAFLKLKEDLSDIKLLLVGPMDNLNEEDIEVIKNHQDILWIDFVKDVATYLSLMSIFVFPSKREGFPLSVIEASLSEKPVILSNIYGNRDTVIHEQTGSFFQNENYDNLRNLILRYYKNIDIVTKHGKSGKIYVQKSFSSHHLIKMQIQDYFKFTNFINLKKRKLQISA